MKITQSLAVLSLFIGAEAVQIHKHHHKRHPKNHSKIAIDAEQGAEEGISANEFASAAVQARIEADADIAQQTKANHQISADAHNKAWKEHFKNSQFFSNYAQHNEKKHECQGKCAQNKKALAQVKFDYERLQNKFEALEAKSVENSQKFLALQQSFKNQENENEENMMQTGASGEPAIPTAIAKDDQGIPHVDAGGAYNPGAASMDPNASVWQRAKIHDGKTHGEKEHQGNANDLQAYGEKQEAAANTRLPYASTAQTSTPTAVAKDKEGLPHVDAAGNYNPGAATMDPNASVWQRKEIHDGKVHGEKQHQQNANDLQAYGDKQETAANTRLPYHSTAQKGSTQSSQKQTVAKQQQQAQKAAAKPVQLKQQTKPQPIAPVKKTVASATKSTTPPKKSLIQWEDTLLQLDDDVDLEAIQLHNFANEGEESRVDKNAPETFAMTPVPVNASLLQTENLIETMPSGHVPLNFGFVHLQNADGDDIMRYI